MLVKQSLKISNKEKRTQSNPLAQHLSIRNLDERDLMLRAERNDELLICVFLAALVEHAHVSLAAVERLGGLAQATGKTVVDQSNLEDALEGIQNGHGAASGSVGGYLDLIGSADGRVGSGLFSVRLFVFYELVGFNFALVSFLGEGWDILGSIDECYLCFLALQSDY